MKGLRRLLASLCWMLVVCAWNPVAMGEEEPPVLRVGRLSYVEGSVSLQREADEDWYEASLNSPVFEGYKIYTGLGARAELQLEDDVTVRLDEDSFVHLQRLDYSRTRIGVVQGTVAIQARKVEYDRPWVELDTPYATGRIIDYANVRIMVPEQGQAEFRVRRGVIEIDTGPNQVRRVHQNSRLFVSAPDVFMTGTAAAEDDFDLWCDMRDARDVTSVSREYVTDRVSGYSDLDRYGDWYEVKEYGRVWRPRVTVVDWAPYRRGRWVYKSMCGWTWVSYEPWGWVPYHYGRWTYTNRHGWCWLPGRIGTISRPRWAPALVGFTYADDDFSFSVSLGGSSVGWFPLGPGDPYYGWYVPRRHRYYSYFHGPFGSFRYYDDHWNNHYRRRHHHDRDWHDRDRDHDYHNAHVAKAVTVIPREDFGLNDYERMQRTELKTSLKPGVRVGTPAMERLTESVFDQGIKRSVTVVKGKAPAPMVRNDRVVHKAPRKVSPIGGGLEKVEGNVVRSVNESPAKSPLRSDAKRPSTRISVQDPNAKPGESEWKVITPERPTTSKRPDTPNRSEPIRSPNRNTYVIRGDTGKVISPPEQSRKAPSQPRSAEQPRSSYSPPTERKVAPTIERPVIKAPSREPVYRAPSSDSNKRSSSYERPSSSRSRSSSSYTRPSEPVRAPEVPKVEVYTPPTSRSRVEKRSSSSYRAPVVARPKTPDYSSRSSSSSSSRSAAPTTKAAPSVRSSAPERSSSSVRSSESSSSRGTPIRDAISRIRSRGRK